MIEGQANLMIIKLNIIKGSQIEILDDLINFLNILLY